MCDYSVEVWSKESRMYHCVYCTLCTYVCMYVCIGILFYRVHGAGGLIPDSRKALLFEVF